MFPYRSLRKTVTEGTKSFGITSLSFLPIWSEYIREPGDELRWGIRESG